jgi:YMGG-like Gly-zipper
MITYRRLISVVTGLAILSMSLLSGCATHQGYQGATLGALTGSAAGALIDSSNPWRGAVIGGGLGATLGGGLTDRPHYYSDPYRRDYAYQPQGYYYNTPRYYNAPPPRNYTDRGAAFGGVTGAAAGALIDNGNPWRGGMIGGFLGSIFGGGIGAINSGARVPVLRP